MDLTVPSESKGETMSHDISSPYASEDLSCVPSAVGGLACRYPEALKENETTSACLRI